MPKHKPTRGGNPNWERERVERVLEYHNKTHGAQFQIVGRAEEVYPQLKGQLNWDWVCRDLETREEAAVEVKKLTDEELERKRNAVEQALAQVKDALSGKLQGAFTLSVSFPNEFEPSLSRGGRDDLREELQHLILVASSSINVGEEVELGPQVAERFPDLFSDAGNLVLFTLRRKSGEGSSLSVSPGMTGFYSPTLNEDELRRFEQLVARADIQLNRATNAVTHILMIIEERQRITSVDTVVDAFGRMSSASWSHIDHVYYLSGPEIRGILLPHNTAEAVDN